MKKLFIFIALIFCGYGLMAQKSAILLETAGTDSVIGKTATTIILPLLLHHEYDYSYQVIPTQVGVGDSLNAAVALWQANDYDGTSWTEITSARDTVTAVAGKLIEGTDAKGAKHKLVLTGLALDTSKIKVYQVLKLDRQF